MIQKSNQKVLSLLMLFMLALTGSMEVKAQEISDFHFNSGVRYSQWVTNSRINSFYRNTTSDGFAVYDAQGNKVKNGNTKFDYVPGLVAKAIVENVQYYSQFNWAQSWALPFFYSMAGYCNDYYNNVTESGGSLDNLNATKMFFGMYELTNTGGAYALKTIASSTKSHAQTALSKAMNGFVDHNNRFVIGTSTSAYKAGHEIVNGGWWHKEAYKDEMWLDGSYMGPALFAQLRNYKGSNIIGDDWTIAYRQIQALWEMCWNPTDELLYHAFAAEGHSNYSNTWTGFDPANGVFHSASYWGRAVGWYFLALVDILEQMDKAELNGTDNYNTLKSHLSDLAAGLAARQDAATGCWYQILDEDGSFYADSYNNKSYSATYNYIESSASALFTAGYLKAIRLGYLSSDTYEAIAKKGYEGLVNNFFATDGSDGVHLFGSCRSAGLGTSSFRDGSKAYYLLGSDVSRVKKSDKVTEGKILGAFILAATEYERQYQNNTVLFERDLAKTYEFEESGELSCPASGSGTSPTYQWYKNGTAIEGATNATLAVTTSGNYYCEATSSGKTIQSSTAAVTVTPPPTVLYSTDFSDSKWSGITSVCSGKNAANETYNGITFHSYNGNDNGKPFTISQSDGTMIWCDNGMGDKYWIAIPVTGVNGSLTITVDNGTTATKFKYVIKQETTISGSPGSGTDNSSSTADPATVTINDLDKSDYVVYLGRSSSSYSTVTSIKITTPASSGGDDPTPTTYTVSYNNNGHGEEIADVTNVTALPNPLPSPEATGYTFGGWYTDSGLTSAATAGASISADTELFAKWTANTYSVHFDANGGEGSMTNESFTYGIEKALTVNAFTRTGYKFDGWATSANGAKVYDNSQSVSNLTATNGGTVDLYAHWTEKAAATVSITPTSGNVTVGSTLDISNYVTVGSSTGAISYSTGDASKATVTNAGVITGEAVGSATITISQAEDANYKAGSVTFTVTVNAAPVPTTNYTVKFYNGDTQFGDSQSIEEGSTVSAPATSPIKDGYTFKGWALSEGSTARVLFPYPVYEDVNFYAVWSNTTQSGGGEEETIFSAAGAGLSSLSIAGNAVNTEITSTNATIVNGRLYATNAESSSKSFTQTQNSRMGFRLGHNDSYFKVVLNKALEAGDVIGAFAYYSGSNSTRGIWLSSNNTRPSLAPSTVVVATPSTSNWHELNSYTVTANDGICGKTEFYIYRATGDATYFTDFTITRESEAIGDDFTLETVSDYEDFESYAGKNKTVTFKRNFNEGKWTTLVLPFSVNATQLSEAFEYANDCELANIQSMTVNNQGTGSISYVTTDHITANTPVLAKIKPNDGLTGGSFTANEYVFSGVKVVNSETATATSNDGNVTMYGVYENTARSGFSSLADEEAYFLYNGKFYDFSWLSNMTPFTAYIVPETTSGNALKGLTFEEDSATGIINLNVNPNRNSLSTGEGWGEVYNLAGQKVGKEYKGMVIKKGKKVIKK